MFTQQLVNQLSSVNSKKQSGNDSSYNLLSTIYYILNTYTNLQWLSFTINHRLNYEIILI